MAVPITPKATQAAVPLGPIIVVESAEPVPASMKQPVLSPVIGPAAERPTTTAPLPPPPVETLEHADKRLLAAEQWILLHAEVQSTPEAGFERRVARYHSGLFWVHDQRVITLGVLADSREDWRPGEDLFRVADSSLRRA
jgi:hypothetical protein